MSNKIKEKELRKVEVKLFTGEWYDVTMSSVLEGDTFRMFEPDGSQVKDEDGKTEWVALHDSYLSPSDIWTVDIE